MPRSVNLGLVDELDVVSIGEPGNRTFNLSAYGTHGSGIVWIEKEQLFNIAESLGRALELLSEIVDPNVEEDSDVADEEVELDAAYVDDGDVEFKAWRIEMQYDDRRKLFHFIAEGPDPEADEREAIESPHDQKVSFYFSHEQARHIANRGMEVVYAGRPLCPHCGVPINRDEEHVCERRNGYHPDDARDIVRAIEDQ